MIIFIKISAFVIYGLAVYVFAFYLSLSHFLSSFNDRLFHGFHNNDHIYDYIVVGAGSAGATLAAELCHRKCNVLLVEAGPPPAYFSNIPVLAPLLQMSPYDWQFKTVPQQHACKGLSHKQSLWPRGKVLGGSSRLNYMAYVPGHPKDYAWFPDYSDYAPKAEDKIVQEPRWDTNMSQVILGAVKEVFPEDQIDFSTVRLTSKDGERWSTDRALENKLQHGLNILTHSLVNKIIFHEDTARGIEFAKWGQEFRVFAKKGVIVSAGAIGSPKLLMLSGIGPKEHLESLGIKVMKDLPVGQNLVDHILTGIDLVTLNTSLPLSVQSLLNPMSALNYAFSRQGPWTSAGIEAVGTFYSENQNNETEPPDLQLMVIPFGVSQDNGLVLRKTMGISDEVFTRYFSPLIYRTTITIAPVLLHPKSFGAVKLTSSNPGDDPLIDPQYLSHKDDVTVLISGIKLVQRLIETEAMKKIGASLYKTAFPGCEEFVFGSTEYWECYVRHLTLTSYHPAGTCRIGEVVDNSFRVLDTKNLYVVDASVLPELPSGNINAAVTMLAKRAAELLKNRYEPKPIKFTNCTKLTSYLKALYGSRTHITSKQLSNFVFCWKKLFLPPQSNFSAFASIARK